MDITDLGIKSTAGPAVGERQDRAENPALAWMMSSNRMSCVMRFTEKEGFFDGKNATRYLRDFKKALQLLRLADEDCITEFCSATELNVQPRVEAIQARNPGSWEKFASDVKATFRSQDATKVTAEIFQTWAYSAKPGKTLSDTFADFEAKYKELTQNDKNRLCNKVTLFIQSAPASDRVKLVTKLKTDDGEFTDDWDRVVRTVDEMVTCHNLIKTVVEPGMEIKGPRTEIVDTTASGSHQEVTGSEAPAQSAAPVDELARLMNEMRIAALEADKRTTSQMEELRTLVLRNANSTTQRQFNTYQASGQPYQQQNQQYRQGPARCLYCDSTDHTKRDCQELTKDLNERKCSLREGQVCLPDGRKAMLNTGRGGMIAEVRQQASSATQAAGPAPATGANAIPVPERAPATNDASSRRISATATEFDEAEVEAAIKAETGWDSPVYRDSCHAYVSAYRDAEAYAMRRKRDEENSDGNEPAVAKRTRMRLRDEETPRIMDLDDDVDVLEAENTARPPKKSPAFKLTSELQRETDLKELVRDRILEAQVTLPLKSLLGLDGTKMQDLFMSLMKRKRVATEKEATVAGITANPTRDNAGYLLEDDEEVVNCFAARGWPSGGLSDDEEDYRKEYWSRATPAISIQLAGIAKPVPALIDGGSEINVMSFGIFELSDPAFPMDTNPGWNMKTANGGVSRMLGACTGVAVTVGSITATHNFFVQHDVSFPVILGQPWIHRMRMSTTVLRNGIHYGLIRSLDGETTLQIQTVRRFHDRHKTQLKPRGRLSDFADRQE